MILITGRVQEAVHVGGDDHQPPLITIVNFVSDIAIFVLKRDAKLQLTNNSKLYLSFLLVNIDTYYVHL